MTESEDTSPTTDEPLPHDVDEPLPPPDRVIVDNDADNDPYEVEKETE